jgi:micrococcal nuclease
MYEYDATIVRVVDGDTVIMDVDLGFYMHARMSCRLANLNARELHDEGGLEAKAHLEGLLPTGITVRVQSVKADKFAGRFDAIIIRNGGLNINLKMVSDGYAAEWDGTGWKPIPLWPIPEVTE